MAMKTTALLTVCLGLLIPPGVEAQELKAVQIGSRIDVTVDVAFFTSYHTRAD